MSERHENWVDDTIRKIFEENSAPNSTLYSDCIRENEITRNTTPYDQESDGRSAQSTGRIKKNEISKIIGMSVIRGFETLGKACGRLTFMINPMVPTYDFIDIPPSMARSVGRATIGIGLFAINQLIETKTGYNPVLDTGRVVYSGHL
jgi:hypothetical protein